MFAARAAAGGERGVTIVGAGLAGAALATLLARGGRRVEVIEKHPDPRRSEPSGYPSINLALSHRGLELLGRLGLLGTMAPALLPMRGRLVHDADELPLQPYDLLGRRQIYSVERRALIVELLDAAEESGARVEFGSAVRAVDLDARRLTLAAAEGEERHRSFSLLLGADGCHSTVRGAIDAARGRPSPIRALEHGYRELAIPPSHAGGMEREALHVWPRGGFMLIALPNPDGGFTTTLFLPRRGGQSFARHRGPAAQAAFFRRHFPDVYDRLPSLERPRELPVGRIVTVTALAWSHRGRAGILGDAAHAMAPFFGQGVNCAFEDCSLLADLAAEGGDDWEAILTRLETARRRDVAAVASFSLANYLEMRRAVREGAYLRRRELAREVQRRFPDRFVPLYSLVSFSSLPYAECRERHEAQEALLDRLLPRFQRDRVDWGEAARWVDELLPTTVRLPKESFCDRSVGLRPAARRPS